MNILIYDIFKVKKKEWNYLYVYLYATSVNKVVKCYRVVDWTILDPSPIMFGHRGFDIYLYISRKLSATSRHTKAIDTTRANYRTIIGEDEPKPERQEERRKFPSHCHTRPRGQTKTKPVENCCFCSWKRSLKDR